MRIDLPHTLRKDGKRSVTMKFYDALQMNPAVLKREIAACDTKQSAMGLSRDKITVRVYKGYIEKGHKEPDPLWAG